jgi:hypothetical protein
MALEDRIRSSVDQAVQGLVSELLTLHTDEANRRLDEATELVRVAEAQTRTELEQQLAEAHASRQSAIDEAVREAVGAERARLLADADQQLQALTAERERAVADAESRALAAAAASMEAARAGEREAEVSGLVRLVESVRGLDGATSLSEVLDALALAAGRETSRAAVVVVKADHIVGWKVSGFGARDRQPKSIDLPFAEAGVIGLAATSSRAATARGGGAEGPGFEPLPADRVGIAMPVLVGGRVVAVVYADGVAEAHDQAQPGSPWPEAIEVLARHAGRCLEALTAQKVATPVPARKASGVHPVDGAIGAAG